MEKFTCDDGGRSVGVITLSGILDDLVAQWSAVVPRGRRRRESDSHFSAPSEL